MLWKLQSVAPCIVRGYKHCLFSVQLSSLCSKISSDKTSRGNLLKLRHFAQIFKEGSNMDFCWGYLSHNGPQHWYKEFPIANEGKRQSPINICPSAACTDDSLKTKPLEWKYSDDKVLNLQNTGASWLVKVSGGYSCLTGGPLADEYELAQFHAHWGAENGRGSEHTVDGKPYSGELHFVHWNRTKYSDVTEAAGKPDGLAVLGIFLDVVEKPHEEFNKVCSLFEKIKFKDDVVPIEEPIDICKFLPKEKENSYWTYLGSLTTPPLYESVTWILFKEPMKISGAQLDLMRCMMFCTRDNHEAAHTGKMVDNFRPTCEMGSRKLRHI